MSDTSWGKQPPRKGTSKNMFKLATRPKTGDPIVASLLRKTREKLGLSQRDVANQLQLSRETYGQYESAQRAVPDYNINAIAKILSLSPAAIGGVDIPDDQPEEQSDALPANDLENLIKIGGSISITIETITPEMAAEYLRSRKAANRPISSTSVDAIVRALKRGQWKLTTECIKFCPEGHLFDGQHRMMAVVRSGIPMVTYVARNVPEDCIYVIDSGKKRSAGDVLMVGGLVSKHSTLVAAAARRLVWYALDDFSTNKITSIEIEELIHLHPGIIDSADYCKPCKKCPPATLTAIHYIGSVIQRKKTLADNFARTLITGEHASPDDPAWRLRERLEATQKIWNFAERDRTCCYAWTQYMRGKSLSRIATQALMVLPGWDISKCYRGNPPEFKRDRSITVDIEPDLKGDNKDETDC